MRRVPFLAALLVATAPSAVVAASTEACETLLSSVADPAPAANITAEGLVQLRDIGYPASITPAVSLSLSPDGQKLAKVFTARSRKPCPSTINGHRR